MSQYLQQPNTYTNNPIQPEEGFFSYDYVPTSARIAVYDDLLSAPRIITITPAPTNEYIENLASNIYNYSQQKGGTVPYSAIREVSENFIHAQFKEIVVSILDNGNTIRFADQGPGITNREKAQLPGFTSATEPMKAYIRGVGSGLPLVKEYLSFAHGKITIEDNLTAGAVVTLTMNNTPIPQAQITKPLPIPFLTDREKHYIELLYTEGAMGITDIRTITGDANSTIHNTLKSLAENGLVQLEGKKRILTEYGETVHQSLL